MTAHDPVSGSGSWLEKQWYCQGLWQLVLLPLSVLFRLLSALRRLAFRQGWMASERLPVPVIVVGNITVGGSGKTPLVLWLAQFLRQQGYRPGIVSRGYGSNAEKARVVGLLDDPASSGDEPVLLARNSACPVWVGSNRVAAGRALLVANPDCDVILCDDGLQHYRLRRDIEIAVVDGRRRFGNGRLLPAGPLREGLWRLRQVDAVVVNGGDALNNLQAAQFRMHLNGVLLRNLRSGEKRLVAELGGLKLHALAGIGHPQRFFEHLRSLGLDFVAHVFPDHHAYRPGDLDWPDADALLMTEKDAVKCAAFADERYWALPVAAEMDPAFGPEILKLLRKRDGREIA
ncbi:MAG: tetraacyldisaccharide 4'-kinase [Sulfuricella denitrificans]|nr:tetraacyldisaccharide 4'-kinase [Sulfuricella denitrificans]